MSMTRRTLIKLFAVLGATLISVAAMVQRLFRSGDAPPQQPAKAPPPAALDALVDTLIPAEDGPGGVDLGVPEKVDAWAQTNLKLQHLLEETCFRLDREAERIDGGSFSALSTSQRTAIITKLSEGQFGEVMQRFLLQLRNEAMTHFYGDRRSWAVAGYPGPPQPNGFMNYTKPPSDA